MENRFPTYNSKAEYDAAKDSLPIPYVATYPSETDGKTVVVYANVDGTNQSEVIATAQLTNIINSLSEEITVKIDNIERAIRRIEAQWTLNINTATYDVTMEGDVNSWLTYRAKLGRYAMTNDGKARKLNRDNSLILEDGTAYDAASCHIMTRFPNLYYSVNTNGDVVSVTLSEREFLNCKAFGDQWIGSYLGTVVSNALVSRADLNPTRSRTIESFFAAAQVNGADWGLSNYHQRQMMMVIYLCEFLSMNSQLNLGLGMTGEGNNWCSVVYGATAGATDVLGDKCGKVNFLDSGQLVNGACHVSLFGVEDPYGWFWEFVQGVYFGNSENANQDGTECYIYEGNRMPTSDELKGTPSGIYRQITRLTSSGYVRKLLWGANIDILPATLGGSSVDGHGEYHYANSTGQVLLFGGVTRPTVPSAVSLARPRSTLGRTRPRTSGLGLHIMANMI